MGVRGKKNIITHLPTTLNIKNIKVCSNCPYRIYSNNNDCITFGFGNITSDIIVVLPYYNHRNLSYNTEWFKYLLDSYTNATGKNMLEDCYFTRLVKCSYNNIFNVEDEAAKHCFVHLRYEIIRIKPKRVITFTDEDQAIVSTFAKSYRITNPKSIYFRNNGNDEFIKELKEVLL